MSVTIPPLAMTYAVYWPREGVLKVGRAWRFSRIRRFAEDGAQVLMLLRDTPELWERAALAELDGTFDRAYGSRDEAAVVLGKTGGYTECFRVLAADLAEAVRTIIRGIRRYVHDEAPDSASGPVAARAADRAADPGVHDGDRLAHVRRRRGAGVGELGANSGGIVAEPAGDPGLDDRRASAAAGRARRDRAICDGRTSHLLRDRRDVVQAEQSAGVAVPASARAPRSGIWIRYGFGTGRGGRGRGGRVEGARRGGPVRTRSGRNASLALLQGASVGGGPSLQELRHCPTSRPPLVRGADLRRGLIA